MAQIYKALLAQWRSCIVTFYFKLEIVTKIVVPSSPARPSHLETHNFTKVFHFWLFDGFDSRNGTNRFLIDHTKQKITILGTNLKQDRKTNTCLSSARDSFDREKNFIASGPVMRPSPSNISKKDIKSIMVTKIRRK